MMAVNLLITQCLQNDFVKPIGKGDPLPNLLHIGHAEARRLLGEKVSEGPLTRVMEWAYNLDESRMKLIHIRDWHDVNDPLQQDHLRQFGNHCIQNTEGAEFVFKEKSNKPATTINSLSLNDFQGTDLEKHLQPFARSAIKVGLVGVWTEAKISFLAYELRTRFPHFEIGVCSALTASSSRIKHFMALDQLSRILGVNVFSSVGEFIEFLGGTPQSVSLPRLINSPEIHFEKGAQIQNADEQLLRYLFRESRKATFRLLTGGFSGNVVLSSESVDAFGHSQVPHVIKIGPRAAIGKERTSFERVESVLGNSAPQITEFADFEERGAIKYRYASMGEGASKTFQKLYANGLSDEKIQSILEAVFKEQLGRLYRAATLEKCSLLNYYAFSSDYGPRIRQRITQQLNIDAAGSDLQIGKECSVENLALFYERDLARFVNKVEDRYFSYLHGDLNGANIIVDSHENVWLIDFFHTHHGHVLKDLIKLENDILYIYTNVSSEEEFKEAVKFSDSLMRVEDLSKPLPDFSFKLPQFQRAYRILSMLRSYYPDLIQEDVSPDQLWIAQLRYAAHALSFDESSMWQKKWALYTACCCAKRLRAMI